MSPPVQSCPHQVPRAVSGTVHAIRVPEVGAGVVKEGFLEEVRFELVLNRTDRI